MADGRGDTTKALQTATLPALPLEPVPTAAQIVAGPPILPRKRIWLYDGSEWEGFVLEWAHVLDDRYKDVAYLGGPGDSGIDIAAFYTADGLEGDWDCFQCKHYSSVIAPSAAWPEIAKILTAAMMGKCALPLRYSFVSPRGCGRTLRTLLHAPAQLKVKFIDELSKPDGFAADYAAEHRAKLVEFAGDVDFSMFCEEDIEKVLEQHRSSPNHTVRFGNCLPSRKSPDAPPVIQDQSEAGYIEKLIAVYSEKHPEIGITSSTAADHPLTREHFSRQRVNFYCAESLRSFARDSVPEGTFEKLEDDVFEGVVEISELDFSTGFERLTRVLQASVDANLSSNALISVSDSRDRKGICHHLANKDRLTWVRGSGDGAS